MFVNVENFMTLQTLHNWAPRIGSASALFFTLILLTASGAYAQLTIGGGDPFAGAVAWETKIDEGKSYGKGDVVTVEFVGKIRAGLHVFSVVPPDKAANLPTTLELNKSAKGVELQGPLKEVGKPVAEDDEIFGTTVRYFHGKAVFKQDFRLTGAKALLSATLNYQVCDEGGMCAAQSHVVNYQLDRDGNLVPVAQ